VMSFSSVVVVAFKDFFASDLFFSSLFFLFRFLFLLFCYLSRLAELQLLNYFQLLLLWQLKNLLHLLFLFWN